MSKRAVSSRDNTTLKMLEEPTEIYVLLRN